MESQQLKQILEAVILAVAEPISILRIQELFDEENRPEAKDLRAVLEDMQNDYADRGIELKELASGFCFQSKQQFSPWIARLWEERAPRYSRALLETLAIIAYRQPVSRAEIEDIRGVAVSSSIIKTLLEREWIKVLGHRDVPGKPGIYGTTKEFLDYFGLKSLDQLPTLEEIKDLDLMIQKLNTQLEFDNIEGQKTDVAENQAEAEFNDLVSQAEQVIDEVDSEDDEPIDLDAILAQAKQVEQSSTAYQAEMQAKIAALETPEIVETQETVETVETPEIVEEK